MIQSMSVEITRLPTDPSFAQFQIMTRVTPPGNYQYRWIGNGNQIFDWGSNPSVTHQLVPGMSPSTMLMEVQVREIGATDMAASAFYRMGCDLEECYAVEGTDEPPPPNENPSILLPALALAVVIGGAVLVKSKAGR